MIAIALFVAAKVVEYLVKIALSVAANFVEYLVEIALSVAAKVKEYLVGIDLSVVAAKVVKKLVEIALSVVAKKVVEYLVDIAPSVAVKVAKCLATLIARPFRYIWNYKTNFDNFKTEETWIPSYKGYMVFEPRMSTMKNILNALSNPDVNMVGIFGFGGIGKTVLAREVAKHTEEKNLFDIVAFAEVAEKPDIKEIQKEIADKLGLTFTSEESVSGRARRLQQRLKQEEKVLLVLDNIWVRLNLEDVGIPYGDNHKGCKLLLTARNFEVLSKMDSQRNFEVGVLDKGEAWSLFEKKAGALAKNVAEACGGLPIAI